MQAEEQVDSQSILDQTSIVQEVLTKKLLIYYSLTHYCVSVEGGQGKTERRQDHQREPRESILESLQASPRLQHSGGEPSSPIKVMCRRFVKMLCKTFSINSQKI